MNVFGLIVQLHALLHIFKNSIILFYLEGSSGEGYMCSVNHEGKEAMHEGKYETENDCRNDNCESTCKGGQCVAYVTCSCTRNGNHPPPTSCWKPGAKVMVAFSVSIDTLKFCCLKFYIKI